MRSTYLGETRPSKQTTNTKIFRISSKIASLNKFLKQVNIYFACHKYFTECTNTKRYRRRTDTNTNTCYTVN